MKFDIQAAAATQTISSTNSSLDDVDSKKAAIANSCESLTGALSRSPTVSSAVTGLQLEVLDPTAQRAVQRGRNATSSTSEALTYYQAGDEEMGSEGRNASASVPAVCMPGVG